MQLQSLKKNKNRKQSRKQTTLIRKIMHYIVKQR